VLDHGQGDVRGREAINKVIAGMPGNRPAPASAAGDKPALRPAAGRHQITNIVITVTGDKAVSRSAWFHVGNDNPQRSNTTVSPAGTAPEVTAHRARCVCVTAVRTRADAAR
jgi:hypothetical protein